MPVAKRVKTTTVEPYWQSSCSRAVVYVGDCKEVMARLEADTFHAVVTDPPYGLEFMGKDWDAPWKNMGHIGVASEGTDRSHPFRDGSAHTQFGRNPAYQQWFRERATAILRVAKPGAHLLSFGGTRMWHRMACAIEDAGFEIRDTVMWCYGTGFPKSYDISKGVDKDAGATRDKIRYKPRPETSGTMSGSSDTRMWIEESRVRGYHEVDGNVPITDVAKQWQGWGTALKPSYEPVIVARKQLVGSVVQNTLEHGCGGLNIDGCRVGTDRLENPYKGKPSEGWGLSAGGQVGSNPVEGRWPANLIHDGSKEVVEQFPHMSSSRQEITSIPGNVYGAGKGSGVYGFNDSGSAARLFYTAKAGKIDKPYGTDTHPTIKPLDLMCYLVRLVCAKGGVVLDPFMGSGSTGCAAIKEGMWFVGIEQSQEYADMAIGRLRLALEENPDATKLETGGQVDVAPMPPPETLR